MRLPDGERTLGGKLALEILVVSPWDLEDPRAWSGAVVPMLEALRSEAETRGHRLSATSISVSHHPVDRVLARASGALHRGYLPQHSWATAGRSGRTTRSEVEERDPDAVVGIAASGVLARARLDVPCVQITDATFRAIQGLYPQFTDLSAFARWQGDAIERAALRRSDQMVVASAWARRSLIDDYGAEPERITVAPFGPAVGNPDGMPRRTPEDGVLRVLAVATDWHRKGGDRAVEVVGRLRDSGVAAVLTVLGDTPRTPLPTWVRAPGRVSRPQMAEEYARHDVLLELTRGAAGGITLADAAGFGLPCVVQSTGGVADVVVDGVTGSLVDDEDQAVRVLTELVDPELRDRRGAQARERFESVLSWDCWARKVLPVIERAALMR